MPDIKEVKELLHTVIKELLERLADLERAMLFINSLQDLANSRFIIQTVIELKKESIMLNFA